MFLEIVNEYGRPVLVNPRQINYVQIARGSLFIDYFGSGSNSATTSNPEQISFIFTTLSKLAYFLDLRTGEDGVVVNMSAIRFVDVSVNGGALFVYFSSTNSSLTLGLSHQSVIEEALREYTESYGGSGNGSRWARRRGL